jgi:hypothetical protein
MGDLGSEGCRQEPEALIHGIIPVQTLIRACPKDMLVVHIKAPDKIIPDAVTVLRIVAEDLKGIAVEPVQTILGPKPKEPFVVLHAAKHGVIGEPLLYLVVAEIIGLSRGAHGEEEQYGKYQSFINQSDRVGLRRTANT